MEEKILLVEDEEGLRMTLCDRLRKEGYSVEFAADGCEGLHRAIGNSFDLAILDVVLPRKNGLDVCRDIRRAGSLLPILMLTARDQITDKVVGLKIGADDYLTKPFEMIELMARVEALLRRAQSASHATNAVQQFGPLRVDLRGTLVTRAGKDVPLSAREFQLLRYFVGHRGTTLSRDEILREVWGYSDEAYTRTVDVHVAGLRHKLEEDPKQPELILTVLGLGYKFAG